MMRLALLAPLALAGCSGPALSEKQRDQVEDIASDVAHDSISDSDKVRELEGRIAELESKIDR